MNSVRRRQLFLGAVLAATTATATTAIVGDQGNRPTDTLAAFPQNLSKLSERFVEAKFLEAGVHTFAQADGQQCFALKLQPNLAAYASPAKTDIIFLVDSTASQAGIPWHTAKALTKQLSERFGSEDRVAIASVAGKVTQHSELASAKDAKVTAGVNALNNIVPMGTADLKSAIASLQKQFDNSTDRRKVIIYIGDGVSALTPMQASDRSTLGNNLNSKEIQFFVVPVGMKPDVLDLSGIASATGGAVLRLANNEKPEATTARFHKSITAPILRNVEAQLPAEVTLAMPGKLPPLRGDQPTLVVGEYKGEIKQFTTNCKGTVDGKSISVTQTDAVLTSTPDCFFLPGMVKQWKLDKDAPALVRGDLALVFASTQTSFAKDDLMTQASFAIKANQLDLAHQLFSEVARLDPNDAEAKAGIRLVTSLKKNPDQGAKLFAKTQDTGAKKEDDLLKRTQQAANVEAQRIKLNVDETLKQARKDLSSNPEDALNRLRLLEQEIRTDPNINEELRRQLRSQLEGEIRQAQVKTERFLADAAEKEAVLAAARTREAIARTRESNEEKLRTSMAQFDALMAKARYEESIYKADEARQYAAALHHPRYTEVTTLAREQANNAYQNAQWERIVAVKRDNYLAAMLTIDESSIPTPDVPSVYYPAPDSFFFRGRKARTWMELGEARKQRWTDPYYQYPQTSDSKKIMEEANRIQEVLNKPTHSFDKFFDQEFSVSDMLDMVDKIYNISLVINTAAFRDVDPTIKLSDIRDIKVTIPRMKGVSLATILTYMLSDFKKGEQLLTATFILRGQYIEITTQDRALNERIVRVTDVGALVMPPIDMTFSSGGGLGGGGLGGGGGGGLGGGGLGGGGLGGGGLGGGGLGGGGLGGGGFGGGGLGGGGLGGGGFGGGGLGGGGLGGGGLGGGGLGGGGLGGGGLGGGGGGIGGGGFGGGAQVVFSTQQSRQFQSLRLQNLIRIVITDADWDITSAAALAGGGGGGLGGGGLGGGGLGGGGLGGGGLGGGGLGGGGLGGGGLGGGGAGAGAQPVKGDPNKDQLFYFDPALAMVVRAPSKRTTRLPSPYKRKEDGGGPAGANPAGPPGGGLGFNGRGGNNRDMIAGNQGNTSDKPAGESKMVASADKNNQDPTNLWNDAIQHNGIDNSLTIASVDFLVQNGKADHAAALLKAALKHTLSPRPWMYDALALSLEMSNGSPDEIEQALLSGADLMPGKSDGFLTAAKAMAKHGKSQKALEYCRKSAELNPQNPEAYLAALDYAQTAKDASAMAWASGALLSTDWPVSEVDLHGQARQAAEKLATVLTQDGRAADATRLLQSFETHARRDLVVKLTYQGEAELELEATDPTGSTCSTLARQSVGGGTLMVDPSGASHAKKYSVAEGFAGQYQFTVRRIWGRPSGNKATLEIIQNQGTPEERIERTTLTLDDEATASLDLKSGRRQAPAAVAAPATFRQLVQEQRLVKAAGQLNQLDSVASAVVVGSEGKMQAVQGVKAVLAKTQEVAKLAQLGQTDLELPNQGGVGLAASSRASADGKSMRVKVEPIFVKKTVSNTKLPIIPGSGS